MEDFIKTCRIVMRERSYNHTARVCKRPLQKLCDPPVLIIIISTHSTLTVLKPWSMGLRMHFIVSLMAL